MLGQVVGKYRIAEQIGEGGMGMVYRAEHIVLGSPAAVKLLLPRWTQYRSVVDRFFTEARAASAIRHVGIVQVFDSGLLPNGQAYIAMELLEGMSLGDLLDRERALPATLASAICCQILAALDAAHVVGVIHRDLKPDNIQLVHDQSAPAALRVKLLDFGIAKLLEDSVAATRGGRRAATRGGVLLGTPAYMSPEQCRAGGIDARSDLYSTGCILFEMLTGAPPFDGDSGPDIVAKHLHDSPPKLRSVNGALPVELEQLIERMLQKDPQRRAPSAAWSLATLERAPLDPIEEMPQLLPPPAPKRAPSVGLPAAALAVVLPDTPLPEAMAHLSAMSSMGRDPRTRTPVMSESGNFGAYMSNRTSAEMAAASMSMTMPGWRRRLPLVVIVVAVLIALVAIVVIATSGDLPELPPAPAPK